VASGYSEMAKAFRNLYSSANTVRAVRSRRMRWVRHVARVKEMINAQNIFLGKPKTQTQVNNIMKTDIKKEV
jgi:hypothetical protein